MPVNVTEWYPLIALQRSKAQNAGFSRYASSWGRSVQGLMTLLFVFQANVVDGSGNRDATPREGHQKECDKNHVSQRVLHTVDEWESQPRRPIYRVLGLPPVWPPLQHRRQVPHASVRRSAPTLLPAAS